MIQMTNIITFLKSNQVFVFGSNTNGYHNGGAAKQAMEWGAVYGIGEGRQGQTYAIPTLDTDFSKLPLKTIQIYLERLVGYAYLFPNTEFLLTAIGQGIAGFSKKEIESIMPPLPSNIINI